MILLTLCSCGGDSTPDRFEDYATRLARSLSETTTRDAVAPSLGVMPQVPNLEVGEDRATIDLLDLLSLNACELGQVVARRNSSLGKLSPPSQRLVYQLDFLRTAPECIDWLRKEGEQALANGLQNVWDVKRERLPGLIWRGIFGGEELRSFWRQPHYVGDYPKETSSELVANIRLLERWVRQWLADDYRVSSGDLEALLASLSKGDGGAMIRSLGMQHAHLEQANGIIAARLERRPVCFQGKVGEEARIFQNVVTRFWLGDLQRWSAAVNQRYFELAPAIRDVEQLLSEGESQAYRTWRLERDELLELWAGAPKRHVNHIKQVYEQCGILPS